MTWYFSCLPNQSWHTKGQEQELLAFNILPFLALFRTDLRVYLVSPVTDGKPNKKELQDFPTKKPNKTSFLGLNPNSSLFSFLDKEHKRGSKTKEVAEKILDWFILFTKRRLHSHDDLVLNKHIQKYRNSDFHTHAIMIVTTWVSPRVKSVLPCARGSNPHLELIGRISTGVLPSLLLPP